MSKTITRLKYFLPFFGRIRLIKRLDRLQAELDAHQARLQAELDVHQAKVDQLAQNLNATVEYKEQILAEVYESRMQTIYNRLTEMISDGDDVLDKGTLGKDK